MRTSPVLRSPKLLRSLTWLLLSLAAVHPSAARSNNAPVNHEQPAPSILALEVDLNGRSTGLIATFETLPDGGLATKVEELLALGFAEGRLPPPVNGVVALRSVATLSYDIDYGNQRLGIEISPDALKVTRLNAISVLDPAHLAPATLGFVLNYAVTVSGARDDATGKIAHFNGGAQVETRLFGGFGVISNSMAATAPSSGRSGVVRLDTKWVWEDPRRLTAVTVGDFVNTGLSWSRPIRMAGIQYARSFDLRPDIITRPVPVLRGTAQAPSTLELFVDGAKTYGSEVAAGPFEVSPGPPRAGAGVTEVVVRDLLGRETRVEVPFYASDSLLASGLSDFGVEVGFARRNFGVRSNDYDEHVVASGSMRHGFTDALTLQAHAELANGFQLVGVGGVFAIAPVALASVAVTGSRSRAGSGGNIDLGLESRHGRFAASIRSVRRFGQYQDLASITSETQPVKDYDLRRFAPPKKIDQVQVSSALWSPRSQLSVSYASVRRENEQLSLATASFSHQLRGATAYIRGWKDFSGNRANGLTIGMSFALGPRLFSASEIGLTRSGLSGVSEVSSRSGEEPGSFSWRARVVEGAGSGDRLAAASYVSPYARIEAGLQHTQARATAFAQATGALAIASGGVFASRRIDGAFAVVEAGAPGVPVLFENRPVGKTGRSGRLLIPDLLPYQVNHVALDTRFLPANSHVEKQDYVVVPRRGSGATVRLAAVSVSDAALVTFVDGTGQPLELGSVGRLEGGSTSFIVGYDGEAYIQALKPENTAVIEDEEGHRCAVLFRFERKPGDQVRVGPVHCAPLQMAGHRSDQGLSKGALKR